MIEIGATTPDAHPKLVDAVRRLGPLPVLDRTVMRVLALCRDDDSSNSDLVATLEHDANFAANLLRYANSAHAARPVRVRTIRQAVAMAGRATIGRLAIEAATCGFLERAPGNGRASVGLMHVHASAVASCSLELAIRSGAAPEVAHLGGLLHDIGKLVMPLAFGAAALDEVAAESLSGMRRVALERERFGCDHALAGAMLANASQVDRPVVLAILGHHDRHAAPTRETACVQVANAVVGMLMGIDPDPVLLECALEVLRLDAAVLEDVAGFAGQLGSASSAGTRGDSTLSARIEALEAEATTDELTGLATRRHWNQRARARVSAGGVVMLCDVDHFKRVNDRNGHAIGDVVLSEVARIISHHGLAGRLGGDELVLLADVAPAGARALGERILAEVREAFPAGSVPGWDAGVSIGVAIATDSEHDLGALLKAADEALYEAKRAGRGRVAGAL